MNDYTSDPIGDRASLLRDEVLALWPAPGVAKPEVEAHRQEHWRRAAMRITDDDAVWLIREFLPSYPGEIRTPGVLVRAVRERGRRVEKTAPPEFRVSGWWCNDAALLRDRGCGWRSDGPEPPPDQKCPNCGRTVGALQTQVA